MRWNRALKKLNHCYKSSHTGQLYKIKCWFAAWKGQSDVLGKIDWNKSINSIRGSWRYLHNLTLHMFYPFFYNFLYWHNNGKNGTSMPLVSFGLVQRWSRGSGNLWQKVKSVIFIWYYHFVLILSICYFRWNNLQTRWQSGFLAHFIKCRANAKPRFYNRYHRMMQPDV